MVVFDSSKAKMRVCTGYEEGNKFVRLNAVLPIGECTTVREALFYRRYHVVKPRSVEE